MTKKLNLKFSFSFDLPIWRLIADDQGKWLGIELRDIAELSIEYFTINLDEEKLFKQDLIIEDIWWTGILAIENDKLIIYKYNNTDNPEKKNFYIVSILTKEMYYLENIIINKVENNKIYGYQDIGENKRVYKKLSLTNCIEQEIQQEKFNQNVAEIAVGQEKNKLTQYPFHYPESHAYFMTVKSFLKQFLQVYVVKGCDYLEQKNAIIISYYIYEGKTLANFLLIINYKRQILLHEKIGNQLEGIGTDTFFVARNRLIFIKNKYQLVGYALDNVH